MRKNIYLTESKKSSKEIAKVELIEKLIKELNTKGLNKLRLIKADLEMGDSNVSLGKLDDISLEVSDLITEITKL